MKKISLLFFFLSQLILAQGYGTSSEIKSNWNCWKVKPFIVIMETGTAYKLDEVPPPPPRMKRPAGERQGPPPAGVCSCFYLKTTKGE